MRPATPQQICTDRLLLRAPCAALAPAVNAFQERNLAHFGHWDPPFAADYFEPEGVSQRYLFIGGAWRDHATFALINPAWGLDEPL